MSVPNPATTDWVPLTGRVDMKYRGAYVPGNVYTDGDVAVYGGIAFICVRPTSAVPSPWGQGVAAQTQVGTYAARPTATSVGPGMLYFSTDTLGTWRSDGTAWTLVAQRPAVRAPSQLDAAPFTTPYDGQEIVLTDASASPTYRWHFRYNASSGSAYKWEFIGGSPRYAVASVGSYTPIGGPNSWQLTGVSLAINVDRAGDYDGQTGVQFGANAGGALAQIGLTHSGNGAGVVTVAQASQAVWSNLTISHTGRLTNVPVGWIAATYNASDANLGAANRWLYVIPVRIS